MPAPNETPPSPEPLTTPVLDAHTHLDAMAQRAGVPADDAFVAAELAAARAVGVVAAITVGDTVASSQWCAAAAGVHPDLYAAVAVHPTEVADLDDDGYGELERLAAEDKVVAIGETGLDYYWDRTAPELQQEHFRRHIELAKSTGLPLMIHDRDAHADVLRILREQGAPEHVVFHAFSGDADMALECVAAGYVLSFPGVVTFRNAPALRAAAAVTPARHLLVETDAPFLTPHPWRGRANAPRLLPITVRGWPARPDWASTPSRGRWPPRPFVCSASHRADSSRNCDVLTNLGWTQRRQWSRRPSGVSARLEGVCCVGPEPPRVRGWIGLSQVAVEACRSL